MKRVIYIGFMVFLFQTFAYADDAQAPATQTPTTQQIIGQTNATIAAAYFPTFENITTSTANASFSSRTSSTTSSTSACKTYLENTLSGAPINTISPYGNGTSVGTFSDTFALIDGLQLSYAIPAAYQTSAKLLVTWTVRIEGTAASHFINPQLCSNWYGTLTENYKSNLLQTQLYVNGEAKGQQVTMEIPGATVPITQAPPTPTSSGNMGHQHSFSPRDPTLIGTYVLTADDFGGTFPETINIEVRWLNKTGMEIKSPTGMRSIIVNFLPVTKQE